MKLLGPPYSLFQHALTSLFYNLFTIYSNNKQHDCKNELSTNAVSQRRTIWREVTTITAFVPNERTTWSFSFYGNERRYSNDLFWVKRQPNFLVFSRAINILRTVIISEIRFFGDAERNLCTPRRPVYYTERQEEKANNIHQEMTALIFKDRKRHEVNLKK